MSAPETDLRSLLAEISRIAHVPVPVLEESLETLGRRAVREPLPSVSLSRYMLEQQPRLKGCVEQVWRAADLWLESAASGPREGEPA